MNNKIFYLILLLYIIIVIDGSVFGKCMWLYFNFWVLRVQLRVFGGVLQVVICLFVIFWVFISSFSEYCDQNVSFLSYDLFVCLFLCFWCLELCMIIEGFDEYVEQVDGSFWIQELVSQYVESSYKGCVERMNIFLKLKCLNK